MSYAADFTLNLGAANAGLTLHAAIVGTDGNTVSHDLAGFTEFGAGAYQWHYASFANGQRRSAVFYTGSYAGSDGQAWTASGITVLGGAALDAELENSASAAAIATQVEAQILDDADSRAVLQAIVDKINAADPDLSGLTLTAIAQAVRDIDNTTPATNSLGAAINHAAPAATALSNVTWTDAKAAFLTGDAFARLGSPAGASIAADLAAVNAKTTNLPDSPAAVGDAMTLTSDYDPAKTPAQAGDAMTLANNALTTTAIADGAITSDKFTVGSITSLSSATGLLERIVAVWRWCFKRKTGPFTSGQVISGNINYYADDDSTVVGQQAAADDGVSVQSLGAVQDA
jgi:hypothetical protein